MTLLGVWESPHLALVIHKMENATELWQLWTCSAKEGYSELKTITILPKCGQDGPVDRVPDIVVLGA